jgi:hypothetical protein
MRAIHTDRMRAIHTDRMRAIHTDRMRAIHTDRMRGWSKGAGNAPLRDLGICLIQPKEFNPIRTKLRNSRRTFKAD